MSKLFKHAMEYAEYSEKSFMVYGETKDHKEALKELGGKFNNNLANPEGSDKIAGWIFPKSKLTIVKNFLKTGCVENSKSSESTKYVTKKEFDDLVKRFEEFSASILKCNKYQDDGTCTAGVYNANHNSNHNANHDANHDEMCDAPSATYDKDTVQEDEKKTKRLLKKKK